MYYLTNRKNVWNPLADFNREMDGFFDEFFAPQARRARAGDSFWAPACDLAEAEGHYALTLDMPGMRKDDIKIELVGETLTISGERRFEESKDEGGAWHRERRYGKFQRAVSLPAGVDADRIEASYVDGVLRLAIPKAEAAKPKQIKITSGTGLFGKLLGESRKKEDEAAPSDKERVA